MVFTEFDYKFVVKQPTARRAREKHRVSLQIKPYKGIPPRIDMEEEYNEFMTNYHATMTIEEFAEQVREGNIILRPFLHFHVKFGWTGSFPLIIFSFYASQKFVVKGKP